ncbi:MAG: hypothetical protein ACP6IS_12500 [Candidatus Asgardarchaeia archaeon]
MDPREMNLFMNVVIYGLARGMTNLMSDTKLVARQAGFAMLDSKASELLKILGFPEIKKGETIENIVKKISDFFVSKGIVGKIDILETGEDKVKLEIRDCIFSQTARMLRSEGHEPVCPVVGLIIASAREATGNELTIKSNTFDKTKNSETFEIAIEQYE